MTETPKTNVFWWAVPAAVVLLLGLLSMFGGVEPPQAAPSQSTYDASDAGVRATYLLLEGLDYDVAQSRRLSTGRVRWVLFPAPVNDKTDETTSRGHKRSPRDEADALARWVRDGGTLLLADEREDFAHLMGIRIRAASDTIATMHLDDPARPLDIAPGPTKIELSDRPDRVWPATGEPLASIFQRGRGEIWIVHRPGIFRNDRLRDADNARAVCRLADETSRSGGERIYFDEFFHGLRERPSAMQLLFQPPALWVTLQGLGILLLLLWRFVPRFGPLRDTPPARRRSKEEFLDAMAYLLMRKGAYDEAFAIVRDALTRDFEREFGLPASTPITEIAAQAARRRPSIDADQLARALSAKTPPEGREGFLRAINELESLRREFFHE